MDRRTRRARARPAPRTSRPRSPARRRWRNGARGAPCADALRSGKRPRRPRCRTAECRSSPERRTPSALLDRAAPCGRRSHPGGRARACGSRRKDMFAGSAREIPAARRCSRCRRIARGRTRVRTARMDRGEETPSTRSTSGGGTITGAISRHNDRGPHTLLGNDTVESLVYMSPVIPSFSGNGLAMRAAHNLRALSASFRVHLLIIRIYRGFDDEPAADVAACCASWKLIDAPIDRPMSLRERLRSLMHWGTLRPPPEWPAWTADREAAVAAYLEQTGCRQIWVFRFYLLPWARAWLARGGTAWLDLDEQESSSRLRLAGLLDEMGQRDSAGRTRREAQAYHRLEQRFLRRFERIA